jgi:hypothetical protein
MKIENEKVFDIFIWDVLSDTPPPVTNIGGFIKVGETSPFPIPNIGDLWTGDGFINP